MLESCSQKEEALDHKYGTWDLNVVILMPGGAGGGDGGAGATTATQRLLWSSVRLI